MVYFNDTSNFSAQYWCMKSRQKKYMSENPLRFILVKHISHPMKVLQKNLSIPLEVYWPKMVKEQILLPPFKSSFKSLPGLGDMLYWNCPFFKLIVQTILTALNFKNPEVYLPISWFEHRYDVMVDNIKGGQLLDSQSNQEFVHLAVHFIITSVQQQRMKAIYVLLEMETRIWKIWFSIWNIQKGLTPLVSLILFWTKS